VQPSPPWTELEITNLLPAWRGLVAKVEIIDNVAHVHGLVVEGVARRLGQEVERARHLLHQHKARQSASARLGHSRDAPAQANGANG
jgi:hypothetical protein